MYISDDYIINSRLIYYHNDLLFLQFHKYKIATLMGSYLDNYSGLINIKKRLIITI